jgi:hypothetical protein
MADKKQSSGENLPEKTEKDELPEMLRADQENPAHRRRGRGEGNGPRDDDGLGIFGESDGLGGPQGPPLKVALSQSAVKLDNDAALWSAIRNRTEAIRGDKYEEFIFRVFCDQPDDEAVCLPDGNDDYGYGKPQTISGAIKAKRAELLGTASGYGVDAYNLLKYATQAFLLLEAGIVIRSPRDPDGTLGLPFPVDPRIGETSADLEQRLNDYLATNLNSGAGLPYLRRIAKALAVAIEPGSPFCQGALTFRFSCPSMLELIWSYWHEEGMLVQTMNAICMRFQNRRGPQERDPLANLEIDPLRPLNNLLWGYIQDEYNRLTVPRRAYEYDHHYGLKIIGKAVPELRSADSRSKFIEAFHNLLYRTAAFYREDADTTVIADGFSLLSSLREVHLLLAEGAHNQFGDLPWTSRAEMLMMQFMLGRPEIREFLRGRAMVPYNENWMGQVDTMKRLQGWTDTTITHFRNLAVYGEQILLSVRYGDWNDSALDQDHAKVWARYWRPEIQGYIHAYLAATGVDLSEDIVDFRGAPARYVQPASLLAQRLAAQPSGGDLFSGPGARALPPRSVSFGALPSGRRRALNPARKG